MASVPSRPAELSDATHHGGWVLIIAADFLVVTLLCLLVRAYVRTTHSTLAGLPDNILAVAGLLGIGQTCLVFWEVKKGLGTSIELVSPSDVRLLQKSWFASTVLYLIALWLAKCCVLCVYLQLTPTKSHNRASYSVIGLCTVWLVISVLIIGVDCELKVPWDQPASQCTGLFSRWQFIAAFNVITELAIFSLSIYLVFGLQMPAERKSVIVLAFGLRLLVVIPTLIRLHYLASIIACVSYCFRSFTAAVSTNYGSVAINVEVYDTTNNRTQHARNAGYGSNSRASNVNGGGTNQDPFAGAGGSSQTTVTAGGKRKTSKTSNESQNVMILDEIRVEQD